jgi:hypothetical protein
MGTEGYVDWGSDPAGSLCKLSRLAMRFRNAVLLATLAIAPVCAKRIRVLVEHRVVNSTLSFDRADGVVAVLPSSGGRPSPPGAHPGGGGGSITTTTTTTRTNTNVGACHRRRTTALRRGQ